MPTAIDSYHILCADGKAPGGEDRASNVFHGTAVAARHKHHSSAGRRTLDMQTESPKTTFQLLLELVSSHITAYREDLEVHDKKSLEENPGVPFLHWTRPTGTALSLLFPHDSPIFPPKGQTTPYLFGRVNRVELSQKPMENAQYFAKNSDNILVYHFDGRRLHKITTAQAMEIARAYARSVQSRW